MTSILKVDTIQTAAGGTPTAADLGLNVSGSVLQVVQVTGTNATTITSQNTWTSVAGTCSITPSSSSSKILIHHYANGLGLSNESSGMRLKRGGSVIFSNDRHAGYSNNTDYTPTCWTLLHLDSPSTTSQIDYTFECLMQGSGQLRHNDYTSTINTWTTILTEIAG